MADLAKPKQTPAQRRAAEVERAERLARMITMRKAGMTLDQIAKEVNLNKSNVSRALKKAMRELYVEDLEEHRKLELARLEDLYRKLYPEAMKGHLGAIDRFLKVSESKRRLLGLDAPARVRVGVDDVDLDAAAAEVMAVAMEAAKKGASDGESS